MPAFGTGLFSTASPGPHDQVQQKTMKNLRFMIRAASGYTGMSGCTCEPVPLEPASLVGQTDETRGNRVCMERALMPR